MLVFARRSSPRCADRGETGLDAGARICPLCKEEWHIHRCAAWQLADALDARECDAERAEKYLAESREMTRPAARGRVGMKLGRLSTDQSGLGPYPSRFDSGPLASRSVR